MADDAPTFRVHVEQLMAVLDEFRDAAASNGTKWVVCIDRPDRHADAKPWDPGRITPFESAIEDHAKSEAAVWHASGWRSRIRT